MNENDVIKSFNMSATRMSSYLTCKLKYWYSYVLHFPRKGNVSFKLGIAVHEALAKAGDIWMKKEQFTANDIARIKNMYREVAAKEGLQDMSIYGDGLEMVLSRVDNFDMGKIVTIEDRFNVTTPDGVTVIGAMDKVVELDEETVLVVDYKTSKYFMTQNELKADIQLSMYDLIASIKYPGFKRIILSLDYLRGEPVYTYRTVSERKIFAKYLLAVYEEMLKLKESDAVPMINDMCNWCDYNDSCPAYKELVKDKSIFKKNLNEYSDEELVEEYVGIKNKSRILYEYEKQLKTHLMSKIDRNGSDLRCGNKHVYIRQNGITNYDVATVAKHVPKKHFINMAKVSKKSVDEYLRDHPESRAFILGSSQKSFTAPFLAYKTIEK